MNEQTSCAPVYPAIVGELHITPDFVALVVEEAARRGYSSSTRRWPGFWSRCFSTMSSPARTAAIVVQWHFEEGLALYETAVMLADGEDSAQAAPTRPVRRNALH